MHTVDFAAPVWCYKAQPVVGDPGFGHRADCAAYGQSAGMMRRSNDAGCGFPDTVARLLAAGAAVDARDVTQCTPLQNAAHGTYSALAQPCAGAAAPDKKAAGGRVADVAGAARTLQRVAGLHRICILSRRRAHDIASTVRSCGATWAKLPISPVMMGMPVPPKVLTPALMVLTMTICVFDGFIENGHLGT